MYRICIVVLVAISITAIGGAGQTEQLSHREKIRAFVQVSALKELAKWEAQKLYPKPGQDTMWHVVEIRAVRDAMTAVANQYQITVAELDQIIVTGLREDWPRPGEIKGGEKVTILRTDKPKKWRMTLRGKNAKGRFLRSVRDHRAGGREVAEPRIGVWKTTLRLGFKLPEPGQYRATFYLRARLIKDPKGAVALRISERRADKKWHRVGEKRLEANTFARTYYKAFHVPFVAHEGNQMEISITQQKIKWRLDRVEIEKID